LSSVIATTQIGERIKHHAFDMMNELLRKKTLTAGKDPMGFAASILYIASREVGEIRTQRDMAIAAVLPR
jgi:transcription initiation factor TFIIB